MIYIIRNALQKYLIIRNRKEDSSQSSPESRHSIVFVTVICGYISEKKREKIVITCC